MLVVIRRSVVLLTRSGHIAQLAAVLPSANSRIRWV